MDDKDIRIRRVNVWIDVISDDNDAAGRWVTARLNGLRDDYLSPVEDFEVTNVTEIQG